MPKRSRRLEPLDPSTSARFRSRLRSDIRGRGLFQSDLAAAIGVDQRTISYYVTGVCLPSVAKAAALAEALVDPDLVDLVREARTVRCRLASCSRLFIRDGHANHSRVFCSRGCQKVAMKGGSEVDVSEAPLRAIATMCGECEPSGICREERCPLRAFSPLPFVDDETVPVAASGPRPGMSEMNRAAASMRLRFWYAQATPEERARRNAGLRRRSA